MYETKEIQIKFGIHMRSRCVSQKHLNYIVEKSMSKEVPSLSPLFYWRGLKL